MEQFNELLFTKESLSYIHNLEKESEKMLKATLKGDTDIMAAILKYAHDTESPFFPITVRLNCRQWLIWCIWLQGIAIGSSGRTRPKKDGWTLFSIRNAGERMHH